MADQGPQEPQPQQPQPQQPRQGASVQQLTEMAEGIVQRLNQGRIPDDGDQYEGIRQLSANVLQNAQIVKQHESYIFQKLGTITAGLLELLGRSAVGLEGLRQAIQQIDANAIPSNILNQINEALMQAPTRDDIVSRINELRRSMSTQGVSEDDINAMLPPQVSLDDLSEFVGLQQNPRGGPGVDPMPGILPAGARDRLLENARNSRSSGGRRPKTKKRGGYGWSGKKGVEVRSSIRTTRRSKGKKGKRSSSGKKKTKKRSSGKK